MPEYAFRARTAEGEARKGTRAAESPADLVRLLRADGLVLVDSRPAGAAGRFPLGADAPGAARTARSASGGSVRLAPAEVLLLTFHLRTMLEAGFPLLVGLNDLETHARGRNTKRIVRGLADSISGGSTFADALDRYPGVFSNAYRGMVRAGESTGRLVEALDEVHGWLEWRMETLRQVRQILTYPAIVAASLVGLGVLMLVWVLPQFRALLEGLSIELPLPTRILVGISSFMTGAWMYIAAACVALVVAWILIRRIPSTRIASDRILLRIPVIGPVLEASAFAQVVHFIGSGVDAGLGLPETLEITAGLVENRALRASILRSRNLVIGGASLSDSIDTSLFPHLVQRMIAMGENTGSLADTMRRSRIVFDRELQRMIKRITSLMEPVMTLCLGAALLFMLLSILLPLYQIYENAGGVGG